MSSVQRISPCLWFDGKAEEAAKFYVSIFKNSRIGAITHYGEAGFEFHNQPAGSVLTVSFELDGQHFTGLNGGPVFTFNEAISFQINTNTQEELDYYWDRLTEGGDEKSQQCGWLKDKFGVSWQVFPITLFEKMMTDSDTSKSQRAMSAMMEMKKIDIAKIEQAYEG